jgi:hypothetical protein
VRKVPAQHGSLPSFTLHVGDCGSDDITVVKAYRVFTASSPFSFAILDRPHPAQTAVLQEDDGIPMLVHLADTAVDAANWLKAHPHRNARVVPADSPEPRLFTYLQDPDHGWLIVSKADLAAVGMPCADFTASSYILEHLVALEEDSDMPRFLKQLDERGMPYRLREQHFKGDAYFRYWARNSDEASPAR